MIFLLDENGSLPYIVGPFNSQEIEKFQKMTVRDLEPDIDTISKIKSQLKNVDFPFKSQIPF